MEELRVPTTAVEAELALPDGRTLQGTVFVPASTSVHSGPTRPDEWINAPSSFFPFLVEGTDVPELFGKASVVRLSVPEPVAGEEEDLPSHAARRRVVVECAASRHEGELIIDMPLHQQRVLDYLNRAEPFLCLHDGDRIHLIHKRHVLRVIEHRG